MRSAHFLFLLTVVAARAAEVKVFPVEKPDEARFAALWQETKTNLAPWLAKLGKGDVSVYINRGGGKGSTFSFQIRFNQQKGYFCFDVEVGADDPEGESKKAVEEVKKDVTDILKTTAAARGPSCPSRGVVFLETKKRPLWPPAFK